jgi:hypothetical protein
MEPTAFQSFKLVILSATGLSRDALHIHLGLAAMLLAALVFRRTLRSPLPWCAALAACLLVEAADLRDDIAWYGYLRWGASAHDVVNTMVWPTLLLLAARFSRVFGPGTRDGGDAASR